VNESEVARSMGNGGIGEHKIQRKAKGNPSSIMVSGEISRNRGKRAEKN